MTDDPIPVKFYFRKNAWVRFKSNDGAVKFRLADFFDRRLSLPLFVFLIINSPVFVHQNLHPNRESVYYRRPDAMETAGHLVARFFAAKFPAGMERRHNCLQRRDLGLLMNINRNATAVVGNPNAV